MALRLTQTLEKYGVARIKKVLMKGMQSASKARFYSSQASSLKSTAKTRTKMNPYSNISTIQASISQHRSLTTPKSRLASSHKRTFLSFPKMTLPQDHIVFYNKFSRGEIFYWLLVPGTVCLAALYFYEMDESNKIIEISKDFQHLDAEQSQTHLIKGIDAVASLSGQRIVTEGSFAKFAAAKFNDTTQSPTIRSLAAWALLKMATENDSKCTNLIDMQVLLSTIEQEFARIGKTSVTTQILSTRAQGEEYQEEEMKATLDKELQVSFPVVSVALLAKMSTSPATHKAIAESNVIPLLSAAPFTVSELIYPAEVIYRLSTSQIGCAYLAKLGMHHILPNQIAALQAHTSSDPQAFVPSTLLGNAVRNIYASPNQSYREYQTIINSLSSSQATPYSMDTYTAQFTYQGFRLLSHLLTLGALAIPYGFARGLLRYTVRRKYFSGSSLYDVWTPQRTLIGSVAAFATLSFLANIHRTDLIPAQSAYGPAMSLLAVPAAIILRYIGLWAPFSFVPAFITYAVFRRSDLSQVPRLIPLKDLKSPNYFLRVMKWTQLSAQPLKEFSLRR